ncbi:MAG: hypothetical protein HRU40_12275, partial [Saprospiraceae bacterium]|nr:hypothetical protein [Saprospiraceae bacterium]
MRTKYLGLYLQLTLLLLLPTATYGQLFQCDGTGLPEFYSMYGGTGQFTQHTNDAINTFIDAEEAIAAGNYSSAKTLINNLFNTYPKGSTSWWNVFNAPRGTNLGTPHAYYGVRMLEDIADYNLNPNLNPDVQTVNMSVVLVGCSQGIQPRNNLELQNGTGAFVTHQLDSRIQEDEYCMVDQSLDLFLQYIKAITNGRLEVNVNFIELPNLCMNVSVTRNPPYLATGSIGPVWNNLNETSKNETDWFWIIYPSHLPLYPDFEDKSFITGGMGSDSKGGPVFIIDDSWLVRKPPHLGDGYYTDIERRIYLPQWLQHEFYHHLYRIYPEFKLEVNGHDWFNRSFWPNDFTGQFEADYYAESLHKRLQSACVHLSNKLITRNDEPHLDLSATMTPEELLGSYALDNVGNPWHIGQIIRSGNQYYWRNSANVQWRVTPKLEEGILETGSDSPYPGQNFKLETYRTPDGDRIPGTIGLIFQGELYRKQFNLLRQTAPLEITMGQYTQACANNETGQIIKANGQFFWETNRKELWPLNPDSNNERFLLGPESPNPGAAFNLILQDEVCGLHKTGFRYQHNYFWRPKRNPDNPNPKLVNPLADLAFAENFTRQSIDVSTVFADEEQETLNLYASSSDPSELEVEIQGNQLLLSG